MDEITAASDTRPLDIVSGPTVTLYRCGVSKEVEEGEGTESRTIYRYTEYRFSPGEYELVRCGHLPEGAEWDAALRRIERSALLDRADVRIAEANDNIATQAGQAVVDAWTSYREAMRAYKQAVRATVDQETFPLSVIYPEEPSQPN